MQNNPFPIVCGRVCPAFCERKCSRGKYDEALAIREIKRLFADWAIDEGLGFAPPQKPNAEKVAIIGAGPAGLACAFYLTRLGYRPVVFEALARGRRHDEGGHPRFPPAQGQAAGRDRVSSKRPGSRSS